MALGNITTSKASGGNGFPVELFQILKDDAVKVLHSICQQIWKSQQWPQDWKRSVFIPIPKKGNVKECSNYHTTIVLISHTNKVMLKILQARLKQYVNHELPDIQAGFRKGRGTRDQIAIIKKARDFQKNIYFCFIDYAKAFDCVDQSKLWKILQEMGIPDHLTCLLRNLYAGQETTVRTGHGTTNWFQIGKGVHQGCIVSPCLFNFYAESTRRRLWHPTPILLPGKSHGWRSLWAAVHGVTESWTRLRDFTFTFHFHALEKEMATHSSVLAWRIPGTGSLVGFHLWGRTELDTTEAT